MFNTCNDKVSGSCSLPLNVLNTEHKPSLKNGGVGHLVTGAPSGQTA